MNRVLCPVDSHLIDDLAVGRVMAERINDVAAKTSTKKNKRYTRLLNRQILGFDDRDPNDQYRARDLVPAALRAYELRHGTTLERGWFYRHPEYDFVGCRPDAIEPGVLGVTVHIRSNEDTYEKAVEDDGNIRYTRVAQASMAITGLPAWLHLEYWEDRGVMQRRLSESLFTRNPLADEMLAKMAFFWCRAAQIPGI